MEISLVVILLFFALLQTFAVNNGSGKLLVILLDGFRWDYFKYDGFRDDGFNKFIREGTKAESLVPTYPTLSYPNYYSLMTGLYPESHGMVGNYMYDPQHNEWFYIGSNIEHTNPHWWNNGDPIWIGATRQNKKCYMFHWPGCEAEIRGLRPSFCESYQRSPSLRQFRSAINQSLELFQNGSADFAAIYFEDVDSTGHIGGPFSALLNETLKNVDKEIAFLLAEMDRRHLSNIVDVIIVSDHGMTDVSHVPDSGIININLLNFAKKDNITFVETGPHVNIFASKETIPRVYRKLKNFHPHMRVYLKHEIPDRWHLRGSPRIGAIILAADLGWFIITPQYPHFPASSSNEPMRGWHGYDNTYKDMDGIFIARGPSFKENYVAPSLAITQLYPVMCNILRIKPSPSNSSWNVVSALVTMEVSHSGHLDHTFFLIVTSMFLFIMF